MSKKELEVKTEEQVSVAPVVIDASEIRAQEQRAQELRAIAQSRAELVALEAEEKRCREEEEKRKFNEELRIKELALDRKSNITKEELARAMPYMRARDMEMVTGIFRNNEDKGGFIQFGLKLYPEDEFMHFELWDDQEYTIPYGVAYHLNNDCHYYEYVDMKDEFGREMNGTKQSAKPGHDPSGKFKQQAMQAAKKVFRFEFRVPGAPPELYPSKLVTMVGGY